MININTFIHNFSEFYPRQSDGQPWEIANDLACILKDFIIQLETDEDYEVKDGIAIHKTAIVEPNVVLKSPVIIGKNCFVAANAYFREGVHLVRAVKIGPGCEIKSSIIFTNSATAHFNYIGNSIIGNNVNFEAGSIVANHYNERLNREISVSFNSEIISTGVEKFGALVGDDSKIGANAVLSPGTILPAHSVVKRLALIEQVERNRTS